MSQIWYAAFSEDFVEQAQKIFKKLDKDVIVTVWDSGTGSGDAQARGQRYIRPRGHSAADTQGSGPAGGGDPHPL